MIAKLRSNEIINNAYQWDGNEEEAREYFNDQFMKVKDNILSIVAYDDQSDVVVRTLNIGDWYIPAETGQYIYKKEDLNEDYEIIGDVKK